MNSRFKTATAHYLAPLLAIPLLTPLLSTPVRAANITLQGTIATDDAVQLFNVAVGTAGLVDIRSYGYAGGTTSTGTVVPRGGFDTILTLFSASGVFIDDNDDGAGAATDPQTGKAGDARITDNLAAGSYIVALTQYDSFSIGNLADGFAETGHPNFTAEPAFATGGPCPGDMFRDISGTAGRCRTGDWAVNFTNVASVTPAAPVPEPGTAGLLGLSLFGFAWMIRKRNLHRSKLLSLLLPVLFLDAWNAQAQQSANPDYSNVTDILKGKRTVVQTTDLELVTLDPNNGPSFTQIKTSNSNQAAGGPFQYGLQGIDSSKPVLNFSAHMFNQPSASTITTLHSFKNSFALWLQDIASYYGRSTWTPLAAGDEPDVTCGAVADFTQDGYDDLALGLADGRILVVSPNSTDPLAQPVNGGFRSTTPITVLNALKAMAAGDFKGDGGHEIAGLTEIPGSGGLALVIYTVDPKSLAVTVATGLTLTTPGTTSSAQITLASIARGRFTAVTHDQLAVAFSTASGPAYVEVIDFDAGTLNAHEASPALGNPGPNVGFPSGYIQVKTGQFGLPTNPYDQIVYHSSSPNDGGRFFEILTVDSTNFTIGGTSPVPYNQFPCSSGGIQVGNFDHRQTDSSNSGQTQLNPNAQIAFLYCSGQTNSGGANYSSMNIYSVDPSSLDVNGNPNSVSNNVIASNSSISFAATDLQGRSYILGPPAKVVVNQSTQPSVVLAMPPMHVDWVAPVNSQTPEILDVSAAPGGSQGGFQTSYDVDASTTKDSSTSDTTSFSFGAKETIGGSFSIGDVDAGEGLQVKDVFTATQDLKQSVQIESGTTHQESYKLKASTTAGDYVLYTDSRLNIWVYPVIGKTVCPATKPNCQPSEKVPLTIQFSAPDQTSSTFATGTSMEWYQPPWEPFNVFSYPANLQQLQAIYPNLQQIATTAATFTDQANFSQQVTWINGSTASLTASFDQNNSYENDLSVNGAISFGEIGAGFEAGLDISGSQGFSQLNKSVTSYSSSTGIGVASSGSFLDPPNYRYALAPVIFGSAPPTGAVDRSPLSTDVQSYGLIRTAFTADPAGPDAGGFWGNYYLPDVALNRPAHWQLTTPTGDGAAAPNCLAWGSGASQIDCFGPGTFAPKTPWTSEFHFMRGFFISNAAHPGQGPQLSMATAGDQLTLQARVYNYSLQPMPDNTTVHVRFYAQPIDTSRRHLPVGNSVLIGEEKLNGIPAFDDTAGAPLNWTLASTSFDTTPYSGQSLMFWVVVWMQGPDGTIVQEMPGHGLKAIPGTLNSLADVQTEDYSNNVGIYKVAFPVLPSSGSGLQAPPSNGPVAVNIGKIGFSATPVAVNQPVEVYAPVSTDENTDQGVTTQFYEGDPKAGGEMFDVERLAYLDGGKTYEETVIYRARSCGTHELFVVVNKGLPNEVVRRAEPVRIPCTVPPRTGGILRDRAGSANFDRLHTSDDPSSQN